MKYNSPPDAPHARLSVNEVNDAFDFTVRFPGRLSDYGVASSQELRDKFAGIVKMASRMLYQVTAGHSRIKGVKLLIGTTAQPDAKLQMRVDPFEYPTNALRSHTRNGLIEVDKEWRKRVSPPTKHPGFTLAHEFMHQRYKLRDEYYEEWNSDGPPDPEPLISTHSLCPISFLGSPYPEMCWKGNHNPNHSPLIDKRNDDPDQEGIQVRSLWEIHAKSLNIPAPEHHPPQVLKWIDYNQDNLSRVDFPLSISVDTGIKAPPAPVLPVLKPLN